MKPGTPERIFFASAGLLVLGGLGCIGTGAISGRDKLLIIGFWIDAAGIALAFLPMSLFIFGLIVEKYRSK
jgi:hypothetical protein